jgi:hypothetical protein
MTTDIARRVVEPELVDEPSGKIRVLVLDNPFTLDRRDLTIDAGDTVEAIIRNLGLASWKDAMVAIDGAPVRSEWWARVRPRSGHVMTVRAIPRGQGDSGTKGWTQILAGVVLIIVGILLLDTPLAALSPYLISAGIGLAISGAITLIFPPPQLPKLKDRSSSDQPVFSITGSRNIANPWGVVPRVFGRHAIFPPKEGAR